MLHSFQSKLQRIVVFLSGVGWPDTEMNDFKEWQQRSFNHTLHAVGFLLFFKARLAQLYYED
jgi:hypothetical protein